MFHRTQLSHSENLPSLETDEFLPPVGRWVQIGGLMLVGLLAGGIGLAAMTRYNVTVQAIAAIRPANGLSVVQAQTGGTVSQILVQDNQAVQQGDVIAEFIGLERSQVVTLQRRRQRLQDYIQQYQTQIAQLDQQLPALSTPIRAELGVSANLPDDRLRQHRQNLSRQIGYDRLTLQAIEQELSKFVILAPITGTLFKLSLRHPGQTVEAGEVVAQIVPSEGLLVAKAQVSVEDISRVAVGQTAQIRISAYPYPDYGSLTGTVRAIAPDATPLQNPNTGMTITAYEVTIQPDQPFLTRGDRHYPLQPGMTAQANIISRQETVMQALLRKLRLWAEA